MHTVHLAEEAIGDVKYSAMGLLFSVDEYTREGVNYEMVETIDSFFESLKWTESSGTPIVGEVPYGKLMMMADMGNRWVYKGSVTTPPCDTFVYWNVMRRIYPLKAKHLKLFKDQLKRGDLDVLGNYREVMPLDEHNPFVVKPKEVKNDPKLTDKVRIYDVHHGQVKIDFSNEVTGEIATMTPLPSGLMQVTYKNALDKKISVGKAGNCYNI